MIARLALMILLVACEAHANGPYDGIYGAPKDQLRTNQADGSYPFSQKTGRTYYGANDGTDSQGNPADWAGDALFAWLFGEASGQVRVNSGSFGSGGDLTEVNGPIAFRSSGAPFGTAVDFIESSNEQLTCTQANCGGSEGMDKPVSGGGWTWGCTANKEKNATSALMYYGGSSTFAGFQANYDTITDRWQCNTYNTSQTLDSGPTSSWLTGTVGTESTNFWHNLTCRLDAAGTVEGIFDGVPSGSPGTTGTPADRGADFFISENSSIRDWDGAVDECYIFDFPMTDASICKIASCGLNMTESDVCACDADGASYTATGYNDQTCVASFCDVDATACTTNADCYTANACTLPACNAAPASE